MFGRKSAEIRELKTALNTMAIISNNAARLVSIERNGRMNVFTFERCGETFIIETMGMLGDDTDAWRFMAGLK